MTEYLRGSFFPVQETFTKIEREILQKVSHYWDDDFEHCITVEYNCSGSLPLLGVQCTIIDRKNCTFRHPVVYIYVV